MALNGIKDESRNRKGKRVKSGRSISNHGTETIDVLFERFYAAKVAEGRAKGTLSQYKNNFRQFTNYLDEKGCSKNITEITVNVIRDYIIYMREEKIQFEHNQFKDENSKMIGLSSSTINTQLKTLRVLFRFLTDEGYLETNPMLLIKDVNEPQEHIDILSVDELKKLLAIPDKRKYSDFRDFVLMNVLIDTFLRITEALTLTINEVDFDTRVITVRGEKAKSRKARLVPINNTTANLLRELIEENKEFDSEYIFLTNYGEQLDRNHFRKRLKAFAQKAGIKKNVHPHLFRHTGATMFLEAGGDIRHLQMILGHADLRMVLRYTHLSKDALINQHEKYSVMNQITGKLNKPHKIKR